jgi:hypothetical protein
MENPKPTNVPKTISTPRADSIPQSPTEAIHRDAIRQHKLELQPPATTDLHIRIGKQLEQLALAKRFVESLGEEHLDMFAQALEANIRPITSVVHNAVAGVLGFPAVSFDSPTMQTRERDVLQEPAEKPAPHAVDQAALKKRLQSLERANHDLRRESNVLNNQMIESTAARNSSSHEKF